jgi:mannose-1-phosphate guanylyltransferase / mannose-6-phosphate isomerase
MTGKTTMTKIYPLIICGGNGTRLWPVSRSQSPKQFQRVGDATTPTFFQTAISRHAGPGYENPWVISSIRHRDTVAAQLREMGAVARVIHEPMGRNTGPAVLATAYALTAIDPGALMVVVPADHVIEGDLNRTVLAMAGAAEAGHIITFGIKPRHAETGFGYITDGGPMPEFPGLHEVERFVEKPPLRKARILVESDIAYWASGISMFAARTIIAEYEKFDAASAAAVKFAVERGREAPDGLELHAEFFAAATAGPTESIVFEKTTRIALAPLDVQWSDVGSWTAMYGISKSNPQGNVLQGDVVAVETTNSMVRSTSRLVTLVGMKDVIVIDTPDALLVTRVGHCQSVKKVAEFLKSGARPEVEAHQAEKPRHVETDFGGMTPLFQSDHLEMVSAVIDPGQSLLLDPVNNRELLASRGEITVTTLKASHPLGEGHRMDLVSNLPTMLVNPGSSPVEVILVTALGAAGAGKIADSKLVEKRSGPVAVPAAAPTLATDAGRTADPEGPIPIYA